MSSASQSQNYEALMAGVTLTHRQLQEFLQKNGVTPIEAIGAEFDPAFHEAVMRVEDGEHPENTVVEELQRGYTMHGRVVRPSMVKVARSS
jgi:molecular chaperone GrpE